MNSVLAEALQATKERGKIPAITDRFVQVFLASPFEEQCEVVTALFPIESMYSSELKTSEDRINQRRAEILIEAWVKLHTEGWFQKWEPYLQTVGDRVKHERQTALEIRQLALLEEQREAQMQENMERAGLVTKQVHQQEEGDCGCS